MKLALFYDTETTGLPLFNEPSEDPRQPHLVQLGAALVNMETRAVVASMDVIVRPAVWEIPKDISDIHGITTEAALDLGVSESMAIGMFLEMWAEGARTRIAHNETFDARILRIALLRHEDEPLADAWKAAPAECTARLSTPICKIPPTERMKAAKRFHHKTPNLSEAYEFFTGQQLQNAHSAMADVRGCMAVYWVIQDGVTQAVAA